MSYKYKFIVPDSLKYESRELNDPNFKTEENLLEQQIRSLIGTYCPTNVEKYQILKQRDDLLCKLRSRKTDVNAAKVLVGTCPDMCPEKERYMRDTQKNLNKYECDACGVMIPEKTVKDYSRSAADQEEPLPHELRPTEVLQMTMNYLILKIASDIPSTSGDLAKWYDFLWSRTRSIRKDITQQMLTNRSAADLVEKCARFHIFSSFRLSHLEESEFSQKMNTENLSKSFQTLRHMYDDMACENRFCDSEAEFRSYDILLNLSDFNVRSQVLSYRPEVYTSAAVQLALELASAFQSNNYVKFFRILKGQASFLQACLCYRYFSVMRHSALQAIVQAYRMIPIDVIANAFAFDGIADAQNFLGAYGLEIDVSDSNIELISPRQKVLQTSMQDLSFTVEPCRWIYDKMLNNSLPEVLYNGPCAVLETLVPTNSFDIRDCYSRDPINPYTSFQTVESQTKLRTRSLMSLLCEDQEMADDRSVVNSVSTHITVNPNSQVSATHVVYPLGDENKIDHNGIYVFNSAGTLSTGSGSLMGMTSNLNESRPELFLNSKLQNHGTFKNEEIKNISQGSDLESLGERFQIPESQPKTTINELLSASPQCSTTASTTLFDSRQNFQFLNGLSTINSQTLESGPYYNGAPTQSTCSQQPSSSVTNDNLFFNISPGHSQTVNASRLTFDINARDNEKVEEFTERNEEAENLDDSKELKKRLLAEKLQHYLTTFNKARILYLEKTYYFKWLDKFYCNRRKRYVKSFFTQEHKNGFGANLYVLTQKRQNNINKQCRMEKSQSLSQIATVSKGFSAKKLKLQFYAIHFKNARVAYLEKAYFRKWLEFIQHCQHKRYVDGFFAQKRSAGFGGNLYNLALKRKAGSASSHLLNMELNNNTNKSDFVRPVEEIYAQNFSSTPVKGSQMAYDGTFTSKRKRLFNYFEQYRFSPI